MKRYFLTRLRIEGFRGINNEGQPLELKFAADKVNSIYALNGNGKSSVYDALSYAILGRIPKLENLEQAEQAESYINNRFHSASTATVELTFTADDGSGETEVKVERQSNGSRIVTSPNITDPEALLRSLRSDFVLLDQETLARFVRDKSLERGRTFARLLGFSWLSDYRIALQKLANAGTLATDFNIPTLSSQRNQFQQQIDAYLMGFRSSYDQLTGKPYSGLFDPDLYSKGIISSLKEISIVEPFCNVSTISELSFANVEKAISDAEKSSDRDLLSRLRDELKVINDLAPLDTEVQEKDSLKSSIANRLEALEETSGQLLLVNYQSAIAVLKSKEWNDDRLCPTCEYRHDASLLDVLNGKAAAYQKAAAAEGQIISHWKSSTWVKRWRNLEANSLVNPNHSAREYETLALQFVGGKVSLDDYEGALLAVNQLESNRISVAKHLLQEITDLEKSLPASMVAVTRQVSTAKQSALDLLKYNELLPRLENVKRQLKRREDWQEFINNALNDFTAAESILVQNRQNKIAGEYRKIHNAITRNSDVIPDLDRPANSERLQLRLQNFYGLSALSANTLLQESYCNAIAIAIFLSTALECPTPARFIVLDDITSSFDGGHQFNLMELFRNYVSPPSAPNGVQIILLTHDTLLEKYLDKATQTGTWRHQKLIGRPPNGPVLTEQFNADRVRKRAEDFLLAGQVDSAAPWIRQYLESVLSSIIRKTGIRVPVDYAMDDNKKMVQNALDAIAIEIDLHSRASCLILEGHQVTGVTRTLVPSLLANFCAHYSTGAFSGVTAHVLLGVLTDIDKLADCFKYDCSCLQVGKTQRRFYRNLNSRACGC